MSARALILTATNWRSEVEESSQPVLVDFSATWCPPCRAIAPTIDALALEFQGRLKVGTVDVDAEPVLAERYDIRAMPTLLVLVRGQVVAVRLGAAPAEVLRDFLLNHAAAPGAVAPA